MQNCSRLAASCISLRIETGSASTIHKAIRVRPVQSVGGPRADLVIVSVLRQISFCVDIKILILGITE